MPLAPWDYHPDLTESRLNVIADILIQVREEIYDQHEPAAGDTSWGFGCRAYDRSRSRIIQAHTQYPWLTIADPTMHLIFNIGKVPARIYTGNADDPTPRTLAESHPEIDQLSLAFPSQDEQPLWRFAVETDQDGRATRVVFAAFADSGNNVVCHWARVRNGTSWVPHKTSSMKRDGIDLPPPKVSVPGDQIVLHARETERD